jgi:hypothetical protein
VNQFVSVKTKKGAGLSTPRPRALEAVLSGTARATVY